MPPPAIRITASNSSRHTPKSIVRHQHFKSTGVHQLGEAKKRQQKSKPAKDEVEKSKLGYTITGYTEPSLYPELDLSLSEVMYDEDEVIEDDGDEDDEDHEPDAANPVVRCMKFLTHNRFDPNLPEVTKGGLTNNFRKELLAKREFYPPVIVKNQMYSIFVDQVTKVDKEVEKLIQRGTIMVLAINHILFKKNVLILKQDFLKKLDRLIKKNQNDHNLIIWRKFISGHSTVSSVTETELASLGIDSADTLIGYGLLTHTQTASEYHISVPHIIGYLSLLKLSSSFIIHALQRAKGKHLLDKSLTEKWELNHNNWYKFYGMNLKFVFTWSYGMGYVEKFNSDAGTGWKTT